MAKETISQTEGLCKEVATCIRIAYDKGYKQGFKDGTNSEYEHDRAVVKAYNDGRTFILDKIRAEVMNLSDGEKPERIWNVDVLQLIDKLMHPEAPIIP